VRTHDHHDKHQHLHDHYDSQWNHDHNDHMRPSGCGLLWIFHAHNNDHNSQRDHDNHPQHFHDNDDCRARNRVPLSVPDVLSRRG